MNLFKNLFLVMKYLLFSNKIYKSPWHSATMCLHGNMVPWDGGDFWHGDEQLFLGFWWGRYVLEPWFFWLIFHHWELQRMDFLMVFTRISQIVELILLIILHPSFLYFRIEKLGHISIPVWQNALFGAPPEVQKH